MVVQEEQYLAHYGIKGMKWGVRRAARKDAKEFARAKMFYGEGAGTRRKLIKAKVTSNSKKDPYYKSEFEKALAEQDMGKHAAKAKRERKRKDTSAAVAKTTRGIINQAVGNIGRVSAASAVIYGVAHATGVDKQVANYAKRTAYSAINSNAVRRGKDIIENLLRHR